MDSPTGTATNATSPAVLFISSAIWLVLGVLGTLWSLVRLLLVMVMGGMLGPETYLATLALYLASGAVFVGCIVFAGLLGRGRRLARLFLSAYVVILPALFSTPSYLGGTASDGGMPSVGVPWRDALLSPAGAAVLLAAAATVLMWLPPANAYISRGGAARLEDGGSGPGSGRVPSAVTAAAWILVVSGIVAALEAAFGLLLEREYRLGCQYDSGAATVSDPCRGCCGEPRLRPGGPARTAVRPPCCHRCPRRWAGPCSAGDGHPSVGRTGGEPLGRGRAGGGDPADDFFPGAARPRWPGRCGARLASLITQIFPSERRRSAGRHRRNMTRQCPRPHSPGVRAGALIAPLRRQVRTPPRGPETSCR